VGEARWLTVVSPAAPDAAELLLEPNGNPISRTHQKATYEAGIRRRRSPPRISRRNTEG
jgi:hypothetical protein